MAIPEQIRKYRELQTIKAMKELAQINSQRVEQLQILAQELYLAKENKDIVLQTITYSHKLNPKEEKVLEAIVFLL